MAWTEAQRKVIETRNKNLLVSAAAGSGKTAVLVERIISMISEGEQPIDIDHLLVVTFTNAAAAQMRERIGKALDLKLAVQPDNEHLQKQVSLLQSAQITTIHSFCLNVIRNYFHMIDLDPSFKMADESEITLMKSDVMADVLERWYDEGREDFLEFIECYSYSKSDAPVEELILKLYNFSMSNPWPKDWLGLMQQVFEIDSLKDMEAAAWMQELLQNVGVVLKDLLRKNEEAVGICGEPQGPAAYIPALLSDREIINRLMKACSYAKYSEVFSEISYARLSSKREEVSQFKKDKVKALREEFKKGLKDLTNQFFYQTPEEMLSDMQAVRPVMKVLFELTLDFMGEFEKKKEEKNLIDFNDLEHFALNILATDSDGEKVPSRAAGELSELFEEILIDEYQDSNLVQETILKSISREQQGLANRFMVGDVKQSIYKFRLAMPELFMEKYRDYKTEDMLSDGEINKNQRIDLDKNFRSRRVVLDSVNAIFKQIMTEPIGGIVYDEAAALKYGELFEETLPRLQDTNAQPVRPDDDETKEHRVSDNGISRVADTVELLLVTEEEENEAAGQSDAYTDSPEQDGLSEAGNGSTDEDSEEAVYTKKELEARMVAKRIKELVNPDTGLMLFDKDNLSYRPAEYKDIIILLRSMTGWSEIFVNILMQEGIPAYADTGAGYFQTVEILTILNMLRIIDNPRQDIPLTGVLYSPIVGLTSTELALIRITDRKSSMYSAVLSYGAEGSEEGLKSKLNAFLTLLDKFRLMVKYTPIHELIEEVLKQTGYYYYVLAMPGGDRRRANIDMLINQAVRFEKGSYSGLFHFIRYIEKLNKYEVDFGEASTLGEQENTVRIMSIHKSKGLEFPVVFVSGLSKQFNTQDLKSSIVIHEAYGVGPEYVDVKQRTKVPTLLKKVIQKKVQLENLGEELRVLYVAMTRAKEKLILSGYLDSVDDIKKKDFTFFEIASAKSYLELVLPSMINCMGNPDIMSGYPKLYRKDDFLISIIQKKELIEEEINKQLFLHSDKEELESIIPDKVYDSEAREEIKNRFNYSYPFQSDAGLRVKMTVSELKKLGQFTDEEQSEILYPEPLKPKEEKTVSEPEATIPEFIKGTRESTTGTDRGTLYHRVLELLDLTKVNSREDLRQELDRMILDNKLSDLEIKKLKQDYIYKFTQSKVAERMHRAQLNGRLFKEKQFVMGIKASEVMKEQDSDELVLIQGIIDVFFEEEDGFVLLDYKSDVVDNEEQLINRYKVQLIYYKKALEQILKKSVKDMIIYSLHLGKEIRIDME